MKRIVTGIFYVLLAMAVAWAILHFEAPNYRWGA